MQTSNVAQRLALAVNKLKMERPDLFTASRPLHGTLNQASRQVSSLDMMLYGYSTFSLMPNHTADYYSEHLPDGDLSALHNDWLAVGNDLLASANRRGSL